MRCRLGNPPGRRRGCVVQDINMCFFQFIIVTGVLILAGCIMLQSWSVKENLIAELVSLKAELVNLKAEHKNLTLRLNHGLRKEFEKTHAETRNLIKEAIQLYDADKTGMADYALGSLGAYAEITGDTESFVDGSSFFGNHEHPSSVECLISPIVVPGECWAFRGSKGSALIHLIASVYITAVSLEHIPAVISTTADISSAPRDFSIWGLTSASNEDKILLGQFEYRNTGDRIQYFKIKDSSRSFSEIELRIHSNHGHSVYTCVYRVRVHGRPTSSNSCIQC